MSRPHRMSGFSLIELLLSVVIISMIIGISTPFYYTFLARNDLDNTTQSIAGALRRAQIYARGMYEDSTWSVRREGSTIVLYRGTNYPGRTASFDESITIPGTLTIGGVGDLTEVQFSKLTGLPNTAGSFTLTTAAGESKQVTINAQGMVTY